MDFKKTYISKNVGDFIQDNLVSEKEKESLQSIITGKALLKNDAINLLITLLQVLTIPDTTDDEELPIKSQSENGEDGDYGEPKKSDKDHEEFPTTADASSSGSDLDEFPTLAQSMVKWTLVEEKNKKSGPRQCGSKDPLSTVPPKSATQLTGDELLHKYENACYFYKLGKCRFGKECKKDHPKFCQKFINFGPIKLNQKGCDSKCNNLHPIACRDSVKSRECARENS